jgi:branched-chain amino acid transport system substrate-binding protein
LGLSLLSLAFVSWSEGQATQGEYKIGVLEPLTGPLAFEGKRHIDGYEVMRDLINAQGGVMGKKLVFVVGDATDPTAAASEANRLITREGVKIITGTYSSTLCGAASEAASRQNVIYWESSCVDPRFNKRGLKNVFRTEIDATGFGWYNIEFIAKHLAPRFNLPPNQIKVAFPRRGLLLRSGRDGVGAAAGQGRFRHAGSGPRVLRLRLHQRLLAHHRQVQAAQSRRGPPHRARQRRRPLLAPVARAELHVQGAHPRRRPPATAPSISARPSGRTATAPSCSPNLRGSPAGGLPARGAQARDGVQRGDQEAHGDEPLASHRLAGSGLWLLKVVLDHSKTDDLDKFRAAVLALDMPVGSMLNGWGVKFAENGQNANERVQHYMLQWQNGKMNTVWPEEFTTLRAKWIPLGPWDQRK